MYDNNGKIVKKREFAKVSLKEGLLLEEEDSKDTVYVYEGDRLVSYGGADLVYDVMGKPTTYRGKAAKWEKGRSLVSYGGHTFAYDAWGTCVVVNNDGAEIADANHIGNLNPFRYRGYYYDVETKLYYLKTRYYDPEVGRFMTIDGIEYLDPETINGLNLYAYCGNNPVMRVDENGNAWWHWLLGAVAVVVLVAVVVASAIVTGGASLVAMGVGFAIGATASVVSQGVTNVINGNGFFDNINIGTVLIGGLAGAAFAGAAFVPGLGGLAGAFGIGLAANVATSSIEQKSIGEILFNGLVGGLAAGLAFGFGQFLSNAVYSSNGFTFTTFFDAARVDGANLLRATLTGFASSWYKFLPNLAPGISRAILNMIGKRGGNLFND